MVEGPASVSWAFPCLDGWSSDGSIPASLQDRYSRCSICIIYVYNESSDYWPIDRPTRHIATESNFNSLCIEGFNDENRWGESDSSQESASNDAYPNLSTRSISSISQASPKLRESPPESEESFDVFCQGGVGSRSSIGVPHLGCIECEYLSHQRRLGG
jgi:hypothetical protein